MFADLLATQGPAGPRMIGFAGYLIHWRFTHVA